MASSSASRLSAWAPPFTISRPLPQQQQQQLNASFSSAMDDLHHENPYNSSSSMLDYFSTLLLDDTDYGVDFRHHSEMHAAEGSQPYIGSCASLRREYNENASGCVDSSLRGTHTARKDGGKEVYQDEKGKELEDYIIVQSPSTSTDKFLHQIAVSDNASIPLPIEKCDQLVAHPNLTNFTPELPSTERDVSAKISSEPLDKYESDVDSPCWKGTLVSRSSPFSVEVSGRMNSPPPKTELEVHKSLNPLAPKFITGKAEGRAYYPIKSINRKQESIDCAEGGRCSLKTSGEVGTQCFDDIHAPRQEYAVLSNSNSSSEHCSTHMIEPIPVEDFFRCEGNSVTGDGVGGSVKSIKDVGQNGSSCISSLAVERVSNIPSSGVIIPTQLEGMRPGASDSDSVILVNSLLNLSELLVQNFSNDFDSLGEQHHDILQHVINNLYVCMRKRIEQRNLVSKSPHPGTYYHHRAANALCKGRYMGFQGTSIKAVGNAYWLGDQNEHRSRKSFSGVFSERDYSIASSFCSTSDAGIEMGDDFSQVMEKLMKGNHVTDEELHPKVLLYKNLWLEAEAELRSMKRKACVARMKTQMDGSKSY